MKKLNIGDINKLRESYYFAAKKLSIENIHALTQEEEDWCVIHFDIETVNNKWLDKKLFIAEKDIHNKSVTDLWHYIINEYNSL